MELSAKGLPSHAYTKVIDFAKIFDKTGMKINMNGIPKVAELTAEQQTRINSLYKDGKKSSKFHDDSLVRKLGNGPDAPKKIADRYLEWCDKAGDLSRTELAPENKRFKPKFEKFRNHPNYYKLLADFSMKDVNGSYTPQEAVKMNFPETETLMGYIRDSLSSQEVRESKIDAEFDSIVDEVEEAFDIDDGVMYSKSKDFVNDELNLSFPIF